MAWQARASAIDVVKAQEVVVGFTTASAARERMFYANVAQARRPELRIEGGQAQDRTADLFFFREALYRLSYLTGITQFTSS